MFLRLLAIGTMLLASHSARSSRVPVQESAPVKIERRDIAPAFLRLDRTFARRRAELSIEQLEAANREMDAASLDFFGLRFASAIRRLERARWTCLAEPVEWETFEALASLRLELRPGVGDDAEDEALITSLFAVSAFADRTLETNLRIGSEDHAIELAFDDEGRVASCELPRIPIARPLHPTALAIVGPDGELYSPVRTPEGFADTVRWLQLEAVQDVAPGLERALRVYRARVALVRRTPSTGGGSIELLLDIPEHVRALTAEAGRLRAGEDPYVRREGDPWRIVPHGKSDLPLRLFAPAGLSAEEKLPLVIAFHGAGGDENFFHEAGGAGRLVQLAHEHRFLLACPRTTDYTLNPKAFDSLFACLAADYPVDPERVYLVGHSLGAITVAGLLKVRGEGIARAVCLAGARGFTTDTPVLVLSGRLDAVVPTAGLERIVERARAEGLPVTLEVFEHQGHTLFVPGALERAVRWLGLEQR